MGRLIEQFARKRGHEVVLTVDVDNRSDITAADLAEADMAIDFSQPTSAIGNIRLCFEAGLPIVVGTTGWYDRLEEIRTLCLEQEQALLYGSNFSIGVNVFFHINRLLAKAMDPYKQYDVQVEEIHHTEKLDAPSGTAITIAEGILDGLTDKTRWVNSLAEESTELVPKPEELLIQSLRIDDVPGTHTVLYSSEVDRLEFKHTAHSRAGFALGAVVAAEWLLGKKGFFQVTEVFDVGI